MNAAEAAALAAIDAAYAEPVSYTGGGMSGWATLMVIWSDVLGPTFEGSGNTVRVVSAEIQQSDLVEEPARSDRLVRNGTVWQPNDVTRRDDIEKWVVVLEEAE